MNKEVMSKNPEIVKFREKFVELTEGIPCSIEVYQNIYLKANIFWGDNMTPEIENPFFFLKNANLGGDKLLDLVADVHLENLNNLFKEAPEYLYVSKEISNLIHGFDKFAKESFVENTADLWGEYIEDYA